jgi:hypothetical protein
LSGSRDFVRFVQLHSMYRHINRLRCA